MSKISANLHNRAPRSGLEVMKKRVGEVARQRFYNIWKRVRAYRKYDMFDESELEAFHAFAKGQCYDTFVKLFYEPLFCVGEKRLEKEPFGPCRHGVCFNHVEQLDLTELEKLDLDHKYPFDDTMDLWHEIGSERPRQGRAWHAGINRQMLCHLLFGFTSTFRSHSADPWATALSLRCNAPVGEVDKCHTTIKDQKGWKVTEHMLRG